MKQITNDFLIQLVSNPKLSLFSLGEELGVSRILNYSTLCHCFGLLPQSVSTDGGSLIDLTSKNFVIQPDGIDVQQTLSQKYVESPSYRSLLHQEEVSDPNLQNFDFMSIWDRPVPDFDGRPQNKPLLIQSAD